MVDRVRDTSVLSDRLVCEVDLTLLVYSNVLEECITTDGAIDGRLTLHAQVDHLSVAATLVIEDTIVIPSVLIVTDQETLGVSGEGGLTGTGETKEDGGMLAIHIRIGRGVHRGHATTGVEVIHVAEHPLLHLTTIPGVEDHLLAAGEVEDNSSLRVETELLPVVHLCLGCIVDYEVRLTKVLKLLLGGTDEHIGDKVCLPSHLDDEADLDAGVLIGTAEGVHDVELLV